MRTKYNNDRDPLSKTKLLNKGISQIYIWLSLDPQLVRINIKLIETQGIPKTGAHLNTYDTAGVHVSLLVRHCDYCTKAKVVLRSPTLCGFWLNKSFAERACLLTPWPYKVLRESTRVENVLNIILRWKYGDKPSWRGRRSAHHVTVDFSHWEEAGE